MKALLSLFVMLYCGFVHTATGVLNRIKIAGLACTSKPYMNRGSLAWEYMLNHHYWLDAWKG